MTVATSFVTAEGLTMSLTAWHPPFNAEHLFLRRARGLRPHGRLTTRHGGGATPATLRLGAPGEALTSMVGRPRIGCAGGHNRSTGRRSTEGGRR